MTWQNWEPSNFVDCDAEKTTLISACIKHRKELLQIDPFMAFPQNLCPLSFGRQKSPLPIGVLFQLWANFPALKGKCPLCGGEIYAFSFGGFYYSAGAVGVCLGCTRRFFRSFYPRPFRSIVSKVEVILSGTAYSPDPMYDMLRPIRGDRMPLVLALKAIGESVVPNWTWMNGYETCPIRRIKRSEDGHVKWFQFLEKKPKDDQNDSMRSSDTPDQRSDE
jgi:hypothetical protein